MSPNDLAIDSQKVIALPDGRRVKIARLLARGAWRHSRVSPEIVPDVVTPSTAENLPNSFDTGLESGANGWLSVTPRVNRPEIPEWEAP